MVKGNPILPEDTILVALLVDLLAYQSNYGAV